MMFQRFADIHDRLLTEERVGRIERTIVGAAFIGFFVHLGLIAVHKISPFDSILWAAVGDSFLSALYTPFSFILFAVLVYLLYGYAIHVGSSDTVDVVNHPTADDDTS